MTKSLLVMSLSINVCLAWAVWSSRNDGKENVSQMQPNGTQMVPQEAISESKPLTWESIASEDEETLVANLKRVGCSPERIKDLLGPEISREMSRQVIALINQRFAEHMPQPLHPDWEKVEIAIDDLGQAEDVYRGKVRRLFDQSEERHSNGVPQYAPWLDGDTASPLSVGLRAHLSQLHEERREALDRFRNQEPALTEQQIRHEMEGLLEQQRRDLRDSERYADQELEEAFLRSSQYADVVRNIPGVVMSPHEMRDVVRAFERSEGDHEKALLVTESILGSERFATFEATSQDRLRRIADDRTSIGHLVR